MNKHEYICKICDVVACKSTCNRACVGCVFVNFDYEILCTGYNGSASGFDHCDDVGHLMVNDHCVRTIHAEQNAVIQAAKRGVSLKHSIVYITHTPCFICTKMLISLRVNKIFFKNLYFDNYVFDWLSLANISLFDWNQKLFKNNKN